MFITEKNHEEIDNREVSKACKLLEHHFEVINNRGFIAGKYEGDKYQLINELEKLVGVDMTEDEKLCFDMLKEPSREKMLKRVHVWNVPTKYCTHNDMIEISGRWCKDVLLGQLWLLYRGFITG